MWGRRLRKRPEVDTLLAMADQPSSVRSLRSGSDALCSVRSFLFLVAMPEAPSGFLSLVVRPGAPSSVLAPSDGRPTGPLQDGDTVLVARVSRAFGRVTFAHELLGC